MTMEDAFEDELAFRFRMGRLSEQDARLFQSLFERWRLRKYNWPSFPRHRERRSMLMSHRHGVLNQIRSARGNGREAMFKVASTTSSRAGTRNVISYVCRDKANDEEDSLRDEYGNNLCPDDAIAALEHWPNYPKLQRCDTVEVEAPSTRLNAPDSIAEGPASEKNTVLTYHLLFSMCLESDDPENADARFAHAVEQTLDHVFVDDAYPLFWAVHDDCPGRPHAHVVLSAVSHHGERMRFDRAGDHVDYIRLHFARMLSYAGIEHSATRREDRQDELAAILSGEEKLRRPAPIDDRSGKPASTFARFPEWFELSSSKAGGSPTTFVATERDIPGSIVREVQRPDSSAFGGKGLFGRRQKTDEPQKPTVSPVMTPMHDACAMLFKDPVSAVRRIRTFVNGDDDARSFLAWRIARAPEELCDLRFPGYAAVDSLERLVRELRALPADELRPEPHAGDKPVARFPRYTDQQLRDHRDIIASQMRVAAYWWQQDRSDKSWDILNSLLDALGKDHRQRQERLGGYEVPGDERIQWVFPSTDAVSVQEEKSSRDYAREIVSRAHPERNSIKQRKEPTPSRKRRRRRGYEM